MDIDTLYEMTKAVSDNAQRALNVTHVGNLIVDASRSTAYRSYMLEYNRLVHLAAEVCGPEVATVFGDFDVSKVRSYFHTNVHQWHQNMEAVAIALTKLTAYLQTKASSPQRETDTLTDLLAAKLRPAIYSEPKTEAEVQNAVETVLNTRNITYQREKVSIPYSNKSYRPDFTSEPMRLALEVKLCKTTDKEKAIIDEINADIPAYKTKYPRCLFVVFDLGVIRDVQSFKADIEKIPGVRVIVVKM